MQDDSYTDKDLIGKPCDLSDNDEMINCIKFSARLSAKACVARYQEATRQANPGYSCRGCPVGKRLSKYVIVDELVSVQTASKLTGLTPPTIYSYIRKGLIPGAGRTSLKGTHGQTNKIVPMSWVQKNRKGERHDV